VQGVIDLVDIASQSVLESVGRILLLTAGVGSVVSQFFVDGVGWVDHVVGGWLVVEWDGESVHRAAFHQDRRRDAELSRLGFVVLRFTHKDLVHRRDWVVDVVRETVLRGRPPFGPRSHVDGSEHPALDTP
jgi:hypothetical protein